MWQTRSGDFALRQADLPPPFQYHSRLGCGREGLTGKKVKQRQQQGVVELVMIDDMFKMGWWMVVGIQCSVLVDTGGLQYQFYLTTLGSKGWEPTGRALVVASLERGG